VALSLLFLLTLGGVVEAADTSLGSYVTIWPEYPSELLDLGEPMRFTAGPVLSFSTGYLSFSFWYGLDPLRTGHMCVQGGATSAPQAYKTMVRDLGWRVANTGPLFLSASMSLLSWRAEPFCPTGQLSALDATTVAGGAGLRLGPVWALAEYGVSWTKATPDFADVLGTPTSSLAFSGGFSIPLNTIMDEEVRYPVEHFPAVCEQTFDLGCEDWCWEGQTGRVTWIDDELSVLVDQADQTLVSPLGVEEEEYVADLALNPRSSPSSQQSVGVALRYVDDKNYAYVELRTDGRVRYSIVTDGDVRYDTGWRRTPWLRAGTTNQLRVVTPGNRVIVYLNGYRVLDEEEVAYVQGDIGLVARSYATPGAWASFDDITVRRLEAGVVLDPRSAKARENETLERAMVAMAAGVAAFASYREGSIPLSCGFIGALLVDLLAPSSHLVRVK
jgi:hypothetical protein